MIYFKWHNYFNWIVKTFHIEIHTKSGLLCYRCCNLNTKHLPMVVGYGMFKPKWSDKPAKEGFYYIHETYEDCKKSRQQ